MADLTAALSAPELGIIRSIEAPLGAGEVLHARVRPAAVTDDVIRALVEIDAATDDRGVSDDPKVILLQAATCRMALAQVVVSWDLTVGDTPVEPTVEGLGVIGTDGVLLVYGAVMAAVSRLPFKTGKRPGSSQSSGGKRRKS